MKMPPVYEIKITNTLLESFENDSIPAFHYEISPLRLCCYGDTDVIMLQIVMAGYMKLTSGDFYFAGVKWVWV